MYVPPVSVCSCMNPPIVSVKSLEQGRLSAFEVAACFCVDVNALRINHNRQKRQKSADLTAHKKAHHAQTLTGPTHKAHLGRSPGPCPGWGRGSPRSSAAGPRSSPSPGRTLPAPPRCGRSSPCTPPRTWGSACGRGQGVDRRVVLCELNKFHGLINADRSEHSFM